MKGKKRQAARILLGDGRSHERQEKGDDLREPISWEGGESLKVPGSKGEE